MGAPVRIRLFFFLRFLIIHVVSFCFMLLLLTTTICTCIMFCEDAFHFIISSLVLCYEYTQEFILSSIFLYVARRSIEV
jgi:hypothetical protein